mmetsp:Transcript_72376/g.172453  ORF Transcript_72376/g.172453 Transcript_72376/m.172453 type:complete len:802 (+) Transcript_72376:99-2504(+)
MVALYCDRVDVSLLKGRWVRSDTKHENWDNYMKWYGKSEEQAQQEILEPWIHIITTASKESLSMVVQLPWREGLQVEYTVPIDGEFYPIPSKILKSARSSLAANSKASWAYRYDSKGLMCEQYLDIKGKKHALRNWRSLLSENEMMLSLHMFEIGPDGSETEVINAVRFFNRIPFKPKWKAATAQFFAGMNVEENMKDCIKWMHKAKEAGADLLVLPENSNRDRQYFVDGKPSKAKAHEMSETLDGDFVKGLRDACYNLGIWLCVGVDLKGDGPEVAHIGQVLIRPDGEIEGVYKKHVLWDYEYTLFEPGSSPYQVFDTELGRLGMLICADGIVPEAARVYALMGAQVLLNSLNSRGPDEMRVHIPLRAIENGVWHVASNSVGNPNTVGLLWPWTGGSEVCAPSGDRIVASEVEDDMVVAEVRPFEAETKTSTWTDDLFKQRRPELYSILTKPLEEVPCACMYGPAEAELPFPGPEVVKVAMMQLSYTHTRECTEWMTQLQVKYAARRGAQIGVLPQLWCFKRNEVADDAAAAAQYSGKMLEKMKTWARDAGIQVCTTLVEESEGKRYHTAYLVGPEGIVAKYRKAHLTSGELTWATAGDSLAPVVQTSLGRLSLLVGDEVWIPEVSRCLALEGVEILLHPADWDRLEAGEMAATERASENRFHLVSVTRLDSPGKLGSQTTMAGEYMGGEPIPLMRYPQGVWTRYGVEEQVLVDLPRRQAHCKMMGLHLDVLKKRFPHLYGVCTKPEQELFSWRNTTSADPEEMRFLTESRIPRGALGPHRTCTVMEPPSASVPVVEQQK